jgi:hypothetical protein
MVLKSMLKIRLSLSPFPSSHISENGFTPLHHASVKGFTRVISILLTNGADRNLKDKVTVFLLLLLFLDHFLFLLISGWANSSGFGERIQSCQLCRFV